MRVLNRHRGQENHPRDTRLIDTGPASSAGRFPPPTGGAHGSLFCRGIAHFQVQEDVSSRPSRLSLAKSLGLARARNNPPKRSQFFPAPPSPPPPRRGVRALRLLGPWGWQLGTQLPGRALGARAATPGGECVQPPGKHRPATAGPASLGVPGPWCALECGALSTRVGGGGGCSITSQAPG